MDDGRRSDPWQRGGQGGGGGRRTEDRELRLRVTGNYFKSLLETALLSQRGRLILRAALPQVADTLACTHGCSHVLDTHAHECVPGHTQWMHVPGGTHEDPREVGGCWLPPQYGDTPALPSAQTTSCPLPRVPQLWGSGVWAEMEGILFHPASELGGGLEKKGGKQTWQGEGVGEGTAVVL